MEAVIPTVRDGDQSSEVFEEVGGGDAPVLEFGGAVDFGGVGVGEDSDADVFKQHVEACKQNLDEHTEALIARLTAHAFGSGVQRDATERRDPGNAGNPLESPTTIMDSNTGIIF